MTTAETSYATGSSVGTGYKDSRDSVFPLSTMLTGCIMFVKLAFISLLLCTTIQGDVASTTCRAEKETMEECSAKLMSALQEQSMGVEVMCHMMDQYLVCVDTVNASCPDMALLQDLTFKSSLVSFRRNMKNHCPLKYRPGPCSVARIDAQMRGCTVPVNAVQPHSSRGELCRISEDYLQCLHGIASGCPGNQVLRESNVIPALKATERAKIEYCEQLQADAPAVAQTTPPTDCSSEEPFLPSFHKCAEHLKYQGEQGHEERCKYLQAFVDCMEEFFRRCPHLESHRASLVKPAQTSLSSYCTPLKFLCPPGNGKYEISKCFDQVQDVDPTDPVYCSKARAAAHCLVGVRNNCNVQVDKYEGMLNQILKDNCGLGLSDTEPSKDVDSRKRELVFEDGKVMKMLLAAARFMNRVSGMSRVSA